MMTSTNSPPASKQAAPATAELQQLSLRRELDARHAQQVLFFDVHEDLAKYSREALEKHVRDLRKFHNVTLQSSLESYRLVNDIMSHSVTGKDTDYLQLNANPSGSAAAVPDAPKAKPSLGQILYKAGERAMGGGIPGAAAMAIQVVTLMWLRTTMNYQYRYGTSTRVALQTLYRQGGVSRFYQGLLPALAQGPLSRFGDTAANSGTLSLLNAYDSTKDMNVALKTMVASGVAAAWRINLMPVDTVKTILQVEGAPGLSLLRQKIRVGGVPVLYSGALAASAGTFAGHYPWFLTHNTLDAHLPKGDTFGKKLARNALIGFCSSLVSDTVSNSIRVTKVVKQASVTIISYPTAVKQIIAQDGVSGLFFRGLGTRLIANGMQGMLFTVLWKGMEDKFFKHPKSSGAAENT